MAFKSSLVKFIRSTSSLTKLSLNKLKYINNGKSNYSKLPRLQKIMLIHLCLLKKFKKIIKLIIKQQFIT